MPKILRNHLFLFLICTFWICEVRSQSEEPHIWTFGPAQGLPSMKINTIAQDSNGYLWIGSNLGIHRFDGRDFKHFLPANSENQVPGISNIGDFFVNKKGEIFSASSPAGINIYNSRTDEFEWMGGPRTLGRSFKLFAQNDSLVHCITSKTGLFHFNLKTKETELVLEKFDLNAGIQHPYDENLFLLGGKGFYIFHTQEEKLSQISEDFIENFCLDSQGNIWFIGIGSKELSKFNLKDQELTKISFPYENDFTHADLICQNGKIWTTTNNGIGIYHIENKEWSNYLYNENNPESPAHAVLTLFQDKKNRIWFAQSNRLHAVDPMKKRIHQLPNTLTYNFVDAADIGDNEILFADFENDQLHRYNAHNKNIRIIPTPQNLDSLEYLFTMEYFANKAWLLYFNGMASYDPINKVFEIIDLGKLSPFFADFHKKTLHAAGDYLWVTSYNDPIIARIDPINEQYDSIWYHSEKKRGFFPIVYVQKDASLLYLTNDGLHELDFSSNESTVIPFGKVPSNFAIDFISDILKIKNEIWFINNGNIFRSSIREDSLHIITDYARQNRSRYSEGFEFVQGDSENLYLLSSTGIQYYDENRDLFYNLGYEEGLTNLDNSLRLKYIKGVLYFLGEGIFFLNEKDLIQKEADPETLIVSFQAGNERKDHTQKLDLNHEERDIRIHFSSVDLTNSENIAYRYRLNPNEPFQEIDFSVNDLYFPNLSNGKYVFEISSINKFSDWGPASSIEFEIHPPFWNTPWFMGILGAGLIFGIVVFYRNREKRLKKINKMETRMTELESEALRAQMNPHFIFNSLNSIKSFIINHEREAAADYLTDFAELIRTILTNSREKKITLEKELEALELYMNIEKLRMDYPFEYEIVFGKGVKQKFIMVPPLTLQPFVENSIWHGFIHKKEAGKLLIDCTIKENNLSIKITDNGVGREKSRELEKSLQKSRSYGILITKERLQQGKNGKGKQNQFTIKDLFDGNGKASGTQVELTIPIQSSIKK